MEDVELRGGLRDMRNHLDRGRTGPDDGDALVSEPDQAPVRVPTGVVVVPAARVERVTTERLDARDARQLRPVQRPVSHDQEPRGHGVAPIRADRPALPHLVPLDTGDLGGEAGVGVEVEVRRDATTVVEDLGGVGVFLRRDVRRLFQEGEVHVRLDVALGAWITVPVPGAPEVTALFDDSDVVDAGLSEPGACDEAGEATTDDRDGDVVVQGRPV